jgi:hypothetical protein
MADRVPGVSDKDLALYRAIVGGGGRKPAGPLLPASLRQTMGPRLDAVLRLAQRRFLEALKRFRFRP